MVFQTVVAVLFVILGAVAWAHQYTIADRIRLAFYSPPQLVTQLADESGMSAYGRRLFYVSKPEVLQEAQFDTICVFGELGLVLGCYNGRNIYILDVQEDRLEPVEPVTAAHEMLHAAYQRLSQAERDELADLFQQQAEAGTSARIEQEIESYRSNPGTDLNNEIHSIYGTEYPSLIPELEDYYAQYFDDRQKVLAQSAEYEKVFNELEQFIVEYDIQLADIKTQIDTLENEVVSLAAQIDRGREDLEALRAAGSINQYNAQVPGFNATVQLHNAKIAEVKSLITRYNQVVVERNEYVIESNDLKKSLDSDFESI